MGEQVDDLVVESGRATHVDGATLLREEPNYSKDARLRRYAANLHAGNTSGRHPAGGHAQRRTPQGILAGFRAASTPIVS